jgi:hypothetical protein
MDARLMPGGRTLPFESYAVCATSPIKPGTVVRQQLPLAGTAQAGVAAKCDPDSFVTAGGFYQELGPTSMPMNFRAFESASTSDFQEWTVDLFAPARNALNTSNPGNVVSLAGAIALCLPIPPLN